MVHKPKTIGTSRHRLDFEIMRQILSSIVSILAFRFRSRASLEFEIIALRHQLKHLRRQSSHQITDLTQADRIFWAWLYRIWPEALNWMVLVKPATVIQWHHERFLRYWRRRSKRSPYKFRGGLRELVYRMDRENPLWGARRIRAELLKLGYDLSETQLWKYLRHRQGRPKPPTQSWRTFLQNHMHDAAGIDMFVVFNLTFKFLYVMLIVSHKRRKILHFSVTEHPTQDWLAQHVTRAFASPLRPKYLVRDRDPLYGSRFRDRLRTLHIKEQITERQSPWQNIFVERTIWTIRRECLDHLIILSKEHLERILAAYVRYYNNSRTHKALNRDCPNHRPVQLSPEGDEIISIPQVGGLHHRYERRKVA